MRTYYLPHLPCRQRKPTTCSYAAVESRIIVAAATVLGTSLSTLLLRNRGTKACLDQIDEAFPGSLSNKELVHRVYEKMANEGYIEDNTILATSLGNDEMARVLGRDFSEIYGEEYPLGGLGGFPSGGVTGFQSMASGIPVNGTALLVFAPHVGVDQDGRVGTIPRRGKAKETSPCCEASVAAYRHVTAIWNNESLPQDPTLTPQDPQYAQLCNALKPYAERLSESPEPMVELPYACYDAQKDMITEIVKLGRAAIDKSAQVAVLGGIQIITPPRCTDYFIPLSFEVFDNNGEKIKELTL